MRSILTILCSIFLFVPYLATAQTPALDVVIESDTIVPAFYHGRSEPSQGSEVRAIAMVNGQTADTYRYRWEVGGSVLDASGPVVEFPAPWGGQFLLRVDALTESGERAGSYSTYVTLSEPEVLFYEQNLLRGLSAIAVPDTYTLIADEAMFRAEPFFVNRNIFNGAYEALWYVERNLAAPSQDPQTLTIRRIEGGGSATVEFTLQNGTALHQRVADGFTVNF